MAEPETMTQPAGRTVRAMLKEAVETGRIEAKYLGQAELHVDGVIIPRDEALDHVLEEDQIVNLVVYPHGGGGGGGGKDVGQILLQVAVIAVSMWVGGGAGGSITSTLFARVAAAAVMVAGNMAISAIYAPKQTAEKANDRYALQSASNSYRQWGMMPLILGPCVIAPDLAVKTFTRAIGDDVWIYGILAHHYGPCQLDDLKIGDTLVSSMGAADVQFVHHLTPGPRTFSLVPNDIDQVDLAPEELVATPTSATPVVRASASEGEQFDLDFYLPGGLYFQKDDGRKIAASVTITVRYRKIDQFGAPVGSGGWTPGLTIPLTGSSKDPLRLTRTLNLPMGRYEFEVKRSVLEDTNEKRHTDVAWSAIRAITFRKPVTDEVLSISEFAIRATALNQGSLAPITAKVTPLCPTWTGTEWGPPVPTANPAALTRWLLTGPAPAKRLLSAQADAGLRAWSQLCDQYGWEAHVPVMEDRTQSEVMALLERAGRASIFWDGTQVIGSAWVEKPVPKQMFTGVNLKDHQFEIAYADPVHAFRVEFQNLEQRGEADEITVYNDGYAEFAGVDDQGRPVAAASLIEALRLDDGQKTPERAYRDARWELGRRKHQRRFDTWSTDIEAVVCRYGNRVRLAWSRAGGEGGARVRTRRWSDGEGSTVTGLRLDREVEMSPGIDYVVDVRLVDQLITGVPVVNPAEGEPVITREIVFVDARSGALSPRRGDMVAFGPAEQVTEDVEILGLEPGEGLTANLTGVRYVAPLLMAGETGPIPELQTRLSLDRQKDPPAPTLLGAQVTAEGVRVGFSMPPWRGSPLTGFSARWRAKPAAGETIGWTPLPDLGAGSMTLTTPPLAELPGEDDVTRAEIELYAITAAGGVSKPLTVTATLPTVDRPDEDAWTLKTRAAASDGTSQPVLIVSGAVADAAVATVSLQYGLTANGPWVAEFNGPPPVVEYEIKGLKPGVEYYVLVTYHSVQGVPGRSLVLGPKAPPDLIAGDLSPESPVVKRIDEIIVDVDALIETYGSTEAATVSAAAADTARALAEQERIKAEAAKIASAAQAVAARAAANNALATSPGTALDAFAANAWLDLNAPANLRQVVAENPAQLSVVNGALRVTTMGVLHAHTAKAIARVQGHRYQIGASVRRVAEGGDYSQNEVRLYVHGWDANGTVVWAEEPTAINPGGGGVQRLEAEVNPPSNVVWLRAMLRIWSAVGATEVISLETTDIEAQKRAESSAAASFSSAQTASAKADEAGQKASAADVARAAAATERALAEAARTTAVGAAETAQGASASAQTSANLAARLGFGQAMNPNPVFSQGWGSYQLPPGWQDWSGAYNAGDNKRPGIESDNGIFLTVPSTGSAESANRGVYQPSGVGSLATVQGGGWYVQELTVRLESGTLNGAGMHLQHYDGAGNIIGSTNINCAFDQTVTGGAAGAGVVGQTYRFAVLIKATAGTKTFVPYAMAFWNGYYGDAPVAKSVTFTKCLVRPATAGEIETGVARNGFGTIHARMTNEETVRASEAASLSVRQGVLEAKATVLPNLLRNSDFSMGMRYWTPGGDSALWTTFYDPSFGALAGALGGNNGQTFFLISDMVRVYGNSTYTISWNGDGGAVPGAVGLYASQFDINGNYIPEGDGLGFKDFVGVNWTTRKATTFTTRGDCAYLKVVVVKPGYANGNPLNVFVSRIMLNTGATVAGWTDAASVRDIAARTTSAEGALATAQGKLQAWIQKRVIAGSAEAFGEMMALDENGNATSAVNFGAKRIGLWNPADGAWKEVASFYDGKARFSGDVAIDGNLVIAGSVNGRSALARDTVTPLAATYSAGILTLNGTSNTRLAEQIITTVGGPVVVNYNGLMIMQHEPAGSFDVTVEMRREKIAGDGVNDLQIVSETVAGAGNTADDFIGKWPVMIIDRPGPGTWRYVMNARVSASNMTRKDVLNRFMSAMELRSNN